MRWFFTYTAFLASLLMAVLAGCQQEPRPQADDVIRFSVSSVGISSASTKADPAIPGPDAIERPANPLSVSGCKAEVWASVSTENNVWKSVFDTPSIEIQNVSGTWKYSGDKYWNRDANYKFLALYPVDANIQSGSDVDQILVNYKDNTQDVMVASTKLAGTGAKTVDLAFEHTCSAVRVFFVDPDRGTQAVRYKITDFKIQNLYMAGLLTKDYLKFTWAPSGERTTGYSWPTTAGSTWDVPATYTAFTPWLFFVPQKLQQEDGKHPAITFSFTVESQTLDVTLPIDTYGTGNTPVEWLPGKMYTYYIMVRPKAIEMTVEWTDWNSVEHDYGQVG